MYIFGFVATILGIVGAIPYIIDTYNKKTKPHRVAWLIFLILSIISLASQFAIGARASLIFFGWFVINNIIIVSLSFRKNGGYGDISVLNVASFSLALASIILWKITDSPLIALICVLIADGIGALLIVVKAYKHPYTETLIMWSLGIVAGFLNVLAVGDLSFAKLAAPTQLFLFNVAIVLAIVIGKKRLPAPRANSKQHRKKTKNNKN
jgi:hypothetical protein